MIILSIETSCDDTCIALINVIGKKRPYFEILSNIVSSQVKIHKKFSGVYPTMAKREHQRNLVPVLKKALKKAKLLKLKTSTDLRSKNQKLSQTENRKLKKIWEKEPKLFKKLLNFSKKYQKPRIDIIAVTIGPGLEPCLWTGVNFAKSLACIWNLPIIPINHIEGHIAANFIGGNSKFKIQNSKLFPAICLIVSGGHTQLILMQDIGKYKIIGETRDDAAGECFDKTARILGLGYPGGPAIAEQARRWEPQICGDPSSASLPRPMIYQKNYDFSFSGLKTAVLYKTKSEKRKVKSERYVQAMCKEIQQAIIDVLIYKTLKAVQNYRVKTIILGGGVVANQELRKQFFQKIKKEKLNFKLQVPNFKLCTDNAAMIGVAGYYCYLKNQSRKWPKIIAKANLRLN